MRGLYIIVILGLAVGSCHAAKGADSNIQAAETSIRLGAAFGYDDAGGTIAQEDTETRTLAGLTAGASALTSGGLAGYRFSDLYADVTYDFSVGFLSDQGLLASKGSTDYATGDTAHYNTAIIRLGVGAPVSPGREIIPYMAAGYQNGSRGVTGGGDFGEFYRAELIGGGLRLDYGGSPGLVLSAAAEGFAVIGGSVAGPLPVFESNIGATAEERVSLGADYRLTNSWHAFAGLGLTHYEYNGSRLSGQGPYEPFSTALRVNSTFGVAYGF